jgi:uncharacterized protein
MAEAGYAPSGALQSVTEDTFNKMLARLGRDRTERRIRLEADAAHTGERGIHLLGFHISDATIRTSLKIAGLYRRGCRNAQDVRVKHNVIRTLVPPTFEHFTILQLSDLHVDMNPGVISRLTSIVPHLSYDVCVITGDYRGKSSGPFEAALDGMARICSVLKRPIYGVLGDHDTIYMVPGLENMGMRILLNESIRIKRGYHTICLAGIDDAHRLHADDIAKVLSEIPGSAFSILLSHTPEVYRQAAPHFNLLLSGHTHGGQICLPGGFPLTLEAVLPRKMGAGPWSFQGMIGYTSAGTGSSVVPVRFNCPPEITLHHFLPSEGPIPNP